MRRPWYNSRSVNKGQKEVLRVARLTKFTRKKKEAYLELLRQGLRRGLAAQSIGLDRHTVVTAVRNDPEFAAEVDQAELDACEIVENSLYQKACDGNTTAIQVWLYNRDPERWKDQRGLNKQTPLEAFLASLPDHVRSALLGALSASPLPGAAAPPSPGSGDAGSHAPAEPDA